jgi:hypothetical protein
MGTVFRECAGSGVPIAARGILRMTVGEENLTFPLILP